MPSQSDAQLKHRDSIAWYHYSGSVLVFMYYCTDGTCSKGHTEILLVHTKTVFMPFMEIQWNGTDYFIYWDICTSVATKTNMIKTGENGNYLWCSKYYSPFEHLAVDEIIVIFKQYIPRKHRGFGIKIFELCVLNWYESVFRQTGNVQLAQYHLLL